MCNITSEDAQADISHLDPPPEPKIHICHCPCHTFVGTTNGHLRCDLSKTELFTSPLLPATVPSHSLASQLWQLYSHDPGQKVWSRPWFLTHTPDWICLSFGLCLSNRSRIWPFLPISPSHLLQATTLVPRSITIASDGVLQVVCFWCHLWVLCYPSIPSWRIMLINIAKNPLSWTHFPSSQPFLPIALVIYII